MSEEVVTIGGQQFIYDKSRGWIDKKTKAPANENLLKLLNTVSPSRSDNPINDYVEAPIEKEPIVEPSKIQQQNPLPKIKTKKVGGVDPINIGGERYIYTNKGWVDEKTKQPIPEKLKALFDKLVPTAQEIGAIGSIESEKIKKKDKQKNKKKPQQVLKPKINKQFVRMVTILADIDSIIEARVKAISATQTTSILNSREDMIESVSPNVEKSDEPESKGSSSLAKIGGIVALTALLATQFNPLYEQVKQLYDYTEKSAEYINGFASQVNGLLEWFNVGKQKQQNQDSYVTSNDPVLEKQVKQETYQQTIQPINNTPALIAKKSDINQKTPVMGKPTQTKQTKADAYSYAIAKHTATKPNLVMKPTVSSAKQTEAAKQNDYTKGISTTPAKPGDAYSPMKVKPNKTVIEKGVPKGDLHALRRWLQAQGFKTSEQRGYDNVGSHSKNSKHYTGEAIDVNLPGFGRGNNEADDPVAGAKMDTLAAQLKDAGYGVIWRKSGHFGHLHVDTGGKSQVGSGISDTVVEGGQQVVKTAKESWKSLMGFMKIAGSTDTQFRKIGSKASDAVNNAAMYKTKKIMESKNKKKAPAILPELPNLNSSGGTIKLPGSTSNSTDVVNQYLRYFEQSSI